MTNPKKKLTESQKKILLKLGYKIEDIEKSFDSGGNLQKSTKENRFENIAKYLDAEKSKTLTKNNLYKSIEDEKQNVLKREKSKRIAMYLDKANGNKSEEKPQQTSKEHQKQLLEVISELKNRIEEVKSGQVVEKSRTERVAAYLEKSKGK